MCKHIARRMLPSLKLSSDHVLLLLSSRTMEDLLRRAAHELERNGRSGEESEETRHALVAAGVGRGNRGGRNAGDRENGERDRGRGQPYTYCAHHGEVQGHNTPDCIVSAKRFVFMVTCNEGHAPRVRQTLRRLPRVHADAGTRAIRSRTRRRARGGRSISAATVPKRLGCASESGPSAGAAESATTARTRTRACLLYTSPSPRD